MKKIIGIVLCLVFGHANAAIVTISLQGKISQGDYDDGLQLWGTDSFNDYDYSGSIRYSTNSVSGVLDGSYSGMRYAFESPTNINWIESSLTVNGVTLTSFNQYSDSLEYVRHQTPAGNFHEATYIDGSVSGSDSMSLQLYLFEFGNSIIPMDGSLLATDVVWGYESDLRFEQIVGGTSTSFYVLYPGVSISVALVPLPTAVWLFGSGLVGLIGVARRKKS